MNYERLREKILSENYPSEQEFEEIRSQYQEIADFIQDEHGRATHFAGSASRKTCMKNDRDIDIFTFFKPDEDRQKLEEKGLEIGKSVFKNFNGEYNVEYAEHPYVKGEINNMEVEIVPCYEVPADKIRSSVDRTPHHSRWVDKNLSEEERKEVVILKKFLKTSGIYGSSLKTQGFSGYLCETLIAEYGSFKELVENAINWKKNKVIDPEDHHDTLPQDLKKKFEDEPLVLIDPVDPERNVASVLTLENYSKFIYDCWRFEQDPGMEYFREDEREITEFEVKQEVKNRADFLVIEFEAPDTVEDIIYPQMRKAMKSMHRKLKKNGFRVYEKGFHVSENIKVFFELDRQLQETAYVKGPSIFHGLEHIEQFNSKYDNVRIKSDRLEARTEREYTDARRLIEDIVDSEPDEIGIPDRILFKMKDFDFVNAEEGNQEWLNYLGNKLMIEGQENRQDI